MKKLFISLFAVWLLPLAVLAQYTYTTNSGAITITGYTGSGGTVTIPNLINGYPVTSIGDYAFQYNNNLTNLIVSSSVLSIGRNTFAYNTNLATVIIPNSVSNIVGGAFYNCTNLASITIGNGVRSVGDSAFANDANLVSLYFQGNAPNFVSLTSVFFGVTGATIYYNSITTGWAASYDALSTETIQSQYGYITNSGSITITNYTGSAAVVNIPAAINGLPVTSVGFDAFYNTIVTSVMIPNSVTSIEDEAFGNCSRLTSVTLPDSLTNIEDEAFGNCTSLPNITLPNNLTSIGDEAFASCNFTNITIPASVTNIGLAPGAFCTSLSSIMVVPQNPTYSSAGGILFDKNQTTLIEYPGALAGAYVIPGSVTNIAEDAFIYCSRLTSLTILSSVTSIGSFAFVDCFNLSTITVDPQNMFFSSVNGVLFNKNQTTIITCPGGFIGDYVIPGSVTSIGEGAFASTYSLTHVTIPNSITNIGVEAFYYALSLTNVTIPSSVTSLGDEAFIYCFDLTNLLFQGNAPVLGGPNIFYSLPTPAKVYYLAGTTGWSSTYDGLPTVELYVPMFHNVSLAGGFGFAVTGITNITVIVEASTNLVNWQPIQTNSTPPFQFNDTHWTNYPIRFYRVRYSPWP